MSATTLTSGSPSPPTTNIDLWIKLASAWQLFLGVASLGGVAYVWSAALALWLKIVLTLLLLGYGALAVAALRPLNQRQHRGRLLSLAVNYVGLIICLLGSLHFLGVFLGADALANTFANGLIFLFTAFLGYVVASIGDRFEGTVTQRQFRTAGQWIAILSGVAFLVAVGVWNGLLGILGNLDDPLTISLVAGTAVFGLFSWAFLRKPAADAFGATIADTEMISGYLFLSPNLVGFLIFFAGPLILSLYVSFTNSDAFGTADWVGLQNYGDILNMEIAVLETAEQPAREVIDITIYSELTRFRFLGTNYVVGAEDRLFWLAVGNTLRFVLFAVPLSVIPALFLATLLNTNLPGMRIFRAVYFLPSVAAVVGIALVWQWLYNSTVGYINYGITSLIDWLNSFGSGLTDPMIRWLSDSDTALLAIVIMTAWRLIGFNTVLFLAGLQNIPKVLYEAATVDGAGPWQQFRNVTIPMLTPTTFFVIITTVITTFQVFEDVFILMGANPAGPGNSTLTMVLYLYQKGFQRFEQGYASAIAWVLFLVIFAATLLQFQRQRQDGSTYDV